MSSDLSGKQVLVTGASAGIGRACALAFARAGATVIATGRRKAELESLEMQSVVGDLNDAGFAAELASVARDADIFLNNAGVMKYAPFLDLSDEDTEAMFRTNVLSGLRLTRRVAQSMVRRGRGHIIVMTSIAAREVYNFGLVYCATKHALSAMARGLRLELQGAGIKVTEVAPGSVDTDIRASSTHPRVQEAFKARRFTPLSPEEVAEAVLFAAQANPDACPDLIELRPRGSA